MIPTSLFTGHRVSLGMPSLCPERCAPLSPGYRGKLRHRPTEAELGFGCGSVWLGFIGERRGLSRSSLWVRVGGPMSSPGLLAGAVPEAWEPWPLPAAHTPRRGKWRPQAWAVEPAASWLPRARSHQLCRFGFQQGGPAGQRALHVGRPQRARGVRDHRRPLGAGGESTALMPVRPGWWTPGIVTEVQAAPTGCRGAGGVAITCPPAWRTSRERGIPGSTGGPPGRMWFRWGTPVGGSWGECPASRSSLLRLPLVPSLGGA